MNGNCNIEREIVTNKKKKKLWKFFLHFSFYHNEVVKSLYSSHCCFLENISIYKITFYVNFVYYTKTRLVLGKTLQLHYI